MTPNLRFNRKLTKLLLKSMPEEKATLMSINWGYDNSDTKVFGLQYFGIFNSIMFYLQRIGENDFRLVVVDGNEICRFYLIEDIEMFLEQIGVECLDLVNPGMARRALEESTEVPNTGIIIVDEEGVYIYDHKNY